MNPPGFDDKPTESERLAALKLALTYHHNQDSTRSAEILVQTAKKFLAFIRGEA